MAPVQFIDDTFLTSGPTVLDLKDGFRFEHGAVIAPFRIVYECYGELNDDKSNAILVCHALSASAHAAGKYAADDAKAGWWDGLVGYGKAIDLNRYFVVCVNFPASGEGTTSPNDTDPRTGVPYGSSYPWITIGDMVESQRIVLEHLGIKKLHSIAGGSLGGMQVLQWAARYPDRVGSFIVMATAAAVPVHGIAWHLIGRKIIESDTAFNDGNYYANGEPLRGLQVARMVGHMTYLSQEGLETKFGRRRKKGSRQFEVDSYLEYQGTKFSKQRDANCYIRIQHAMDEMDLEEEYGELSTAFASFRGRALLVGFDTDWLFPIGEVRRLHVALKEKNIDAELVEISSINGHDSFLVDYHLITPPVADFLGATPT